MQRPAFDELTRERPVCRQLMKLLHIFAVKDEDIYYLIKNSYSYETWATEKRLMEIIEN